MMERLHCRFALAITLLLVSTVSRAASIAELQSAQRLEISAQLLPADNIVPGQKVELIITIATDRWFAGGTRLEIPEVPGLVILQTNDFANNASENRSGNSWVIQRWTLDVYPQREGSFSIGPIETRVAINDEVSGNISGVLQSPTVHFKASIPDALMRVEQWVASPAYEVSQRFDRELEQLKPGDAFERTIIFEASEVMAMMLPSFSAEDLPGLAAYPQPAALSNNSNRGNTTAIRTERITYIAEEPGKYQLPARNYYWWDTRTGQLQILFLPSVELVVGAVAGNVSKVDKPRLLADIKWQRILIYAAFIAAVIALGWYLFRRGPRIPVARITAPIKRALHSLNKMRRPALPASLNPDNSAGE